MTPWPGLFGTAVSLVLGILLLASNVYQNAAASGLQGRGSALRLGGVDGGQDPDIAGLELVQAQVVHR